MKNLRYRSLQAQVCAIARQASIIRKPFRMVAETDLVIRVVVAAIAGHQLALPIALEPGARDDVEDTVGTVSVFGRVAATLYFQVVDVLGIELRADVRCDIGVRHRNTIEQPGDLVPAANVQLVMNHVGAWNVIGDHCQAAGPVGAGSLRNLLAADNVRGRGRLRVHSRRRLGHLHRFTLRCHIQAEV